MKLRIIVSILVIAPLACCAKSERSNPSLICAGAETQTAALNVISNTLPPALKSQFQALLQSNNARLTEIILKGVDETTDRVDCAGSLEFTKSEIPQLQKFAIEFSRQPTADGKQYHYTANFPQAVGLAVMSTAEVLQPFVAETPVGSETASGNSDLDDPQIAEAIANGPNFAGKYAVVRLSCGTNCDSGVIVDVESKRQFDLPYGQNLEGGETDEQYYGLDYSYQLGSDVLSARWGLRNDAGDVVKCISQELRWTGARFQILKTEELVGSCNN